MNGRSGSYWVQSLESWMVANFILPVKEGMQLQMHLRHLENERTELIAGINDGCKARLDALLKQYLPKGH